MRKLIMLIPASILGTVLTASLYNSVMTPPKVNIVPSKESVLLVEKTNQQVPLTRDPIWNLSVVYNGTKVKTFEVVSGRAYRQNEN